MLYVLCINGWRNAIIHDGATHILFMCVRRRVIFALSQQTVCIRKDCHFQGEVARSTLLRPGSLQTSVRLEGKTAGVDIKRTAAPKRKETREIKC